MRRTNKILIVATLIAVMLLGIGYAAIQNITLNIEGTAEADPSQANFTVRFSGTPEVSDVDKVKAAITNDTNATINVEGLTAKGDMVTATYTVENTSADLSADLSVETTNSNEEYFAIEADLGKQSLVAGEATTLTLTVELIKTPITATETSTIGVQLEAAPVQPGEEGTTLIPGTPEGGNTGLEQNEFGFYFDQPYSVTVEGVKTTFVFHEDTSFEMYADGRLVQKIPAGLISYDSFSIDLSAIDTGILTVSSDGRQLYTESSEIILELDLSFEAIPVPEGAFYIRMNDITSTYEIYDSMPATVSDNDVYVYGDYYYVFHPNISGWNVGLLEAGSVSQLSSLGIEIECEPTDKNQTSYDPILESINGEPITAMQNTFFACTSLTTAPVIPRGVTDMLYAFNGCTSLTTAPVIPSSVTVMLGTFMECTSLTGIITINASNVTVDNNCFYNVDMSKITLTGEASKDVLNLLGSTGNNYTPIT